MIISKNTARTLTAISLWGMPLGFYGSCAYTDHEINRLDKNSSSYEAERDNLKRIKNIIAPTLFGLFLTTYIIGNVVYSRREEEEIVKNASDHLKTDNDELKEESLDSVVED
ncbi:MAG: hypothetical protein KKA62_06250 [Nanoarchaeota archaeon]|nr:hypothetical protein [Nanoarchaeota archaeon]MBU1644169.1 hypothetical protein [Nanoarchaeota archaeon]MBU1977526.1 hypothetical protein [Nanoarchaeota archaeon]